MSLLVYIGNDPAPDEASIRLLRNLTQQGRRKTIGLKGSRWGSMLFGLRTGADVSCLLVGPWSPLHRGLTTSRGRRGLGIQPLESTQDRLFLVEPVLGSWQALGVQSFISPVRPYNTLQVGRETQTPNSSRISYTFPQLCSRNWTLFIPYIATSIISKT